MHKNELGIMRMIQDEQAEWSIRNFGKQPDVNPLLGIGEELGEFFEATASVDKVDALCDTVIYSMDYATRRGWDLSAIVGDMVQLIAETPLVCAMAASDCPFFVALGRLNHAHLKERQGIRGDALVHVENAKEALAAIVFECESEFYQLPQSRKISFIEAVSAVWSTVVEKRDWKNDPELKEKAGEA